MNKIPYLLFVMFVCNLLFLFSFTSVNIIHKDYVIFISYGCQTENSNFPSISFTNSQSTSPLYIISIVFFNVIRNEKNI